MKKLFTIFGASIILLGGLILNANAQMMMGGLPAQAGLRASDVNWNEVVEHTLREEKEGKELWDKFQAKEVACADLTDEQFGVLGEYFMGQMMEIRMRR